MSGENGIEIMTLIGGFVVSRRKWEGWWRCTQSIRLSRAIWLLFQMQKSEICILWKALSRWTTSFAGHGQLRAPMQETVAAKVPAVKVAKYKYMAWQTHQISFLSNKVVRGNDIILSENNVSITYMIPTSFHFNNTFLAGESGEDGEGGLGGKGATNGKNYHLKIH